ncbi:MAG: PHP domain-containing protein [Clostridia bacterium]|nr:PHP domain-containing protein [Clostridia bacterium]
MKITHDFHVHTTLSLCANETATVDNYLAIAKRLGLKKMGFSDHFGKPDISGARGFYRAHPLEHNLSLKPIVRERSTPELQLYFGCETEYFPLHRDVAITEAEAEQFDFITVPNSHTHMIMPKDYIGNYQKHVDFMIQAYEDTLNSPVSRYITAMAHPFDAVCCPYDYKILIRMISDDQFKRLFDKTAEKGIAVEINTSYTKGMTPQEIADDVHIPMFLLAKECGCKFIFGSDAHDDQHHACFANADLIADLLSLHEEDLAEICR